MTLDDDTRREIEVLRQFGREQKRRACYWLGIHDAFVSHLVADERVCLWTWRRLMEATIELVRFR